MIRPTTQNSWKRVPIASKSALVRSLLEAVHTSEALYSTACEDAGISRFTLTKWKVGKSYPRLLDFEALANSIGYEVTITKMEQAK